MDNTKLIFAQWQARRAAGATQNADEDEDPTTLKHPHGDESDTNLDGHWQWY